MKCKEKRSKLSPKCRQREKGNSRPGCDSKHLYINTEKMITKSMRALHVAETEDDYRHNDAVAKCSRAGGQTRIREHWKQRRRHALVHKCASGNAGAKPRASSIQPCCGNVGTSSPSCRQIGRFAKRGQGCDQCRHMLSSRKCAVASVHSA